MRVLHVTNWYPNAREEHEALFIRRHIQALSDHCENTVVHLQFEASDRFERVGPDPGGEQWVYHWRLPTRTWRIIEWLSSLFLRYLLRFKFKPEGYDVVNVHIAYPLCTWVKGLKKRMKKAGVPLIITEHWTAYHFHFNLPKDTHKLDRIKRIFHHGVPLITVSEALKKDIEAFSGVEQEHAFIVPNVVDTKVFYPSEEEREEKERPVFFMLNYWRRIKSPFVLFEAFEELLKDRPQAQLRVGGYGPLWGEMERHVQERGLENRVQLLGKLDKEKVGQEMRYADAFVHAASYETFSVVCAEALCCGTPVAVTRIPAVEEFIDKENGVLVDELSDWKRTLEYLSSACFSSDRISEKAQRRFSRDSVGSTYYRTLSENVGKVHERSA